MSGAGGKAFCAGGDIMALYNAGIEKAGSDKNVLAEFPASEYLLDYSMVTMKPYQIALWNGVVMGGGVGLSCHAPIRVATDNTLYAMPETGIGFFTDVAGSYFLPRIKGNSCIGMFLGLTGHRLKARDVVTWGVATHFVPQEKMETLKNDIIHNVSENSSDKDIEEIVNAHAEEDTGSIPDLDHINRAFTSDGTVQDIVSRLESSDTDFARKTLKRLSGLSPLSLGVVFE